MNKVLVVFSFVLFALLAFIYYAFYVNANMLLYPSAKYRSVQIALGPIKDEGLDIANKIKWENYEIQESIKNKYKNVDNWKIEIINENKFQMIKHVFNSGKLVLEISPMDSMKYKWKYYPIKDSKEEYLYIAP